MKPITEEHRQTLVEFIKTRMVLTKDDSLMADVYELALASLTAEPIAYLAWYRGMASVDDCREWYDVVGKGGRSCDGSDAFPVYTAPPVPVIKPDQLEGLQVSVDVSTCDADSGNRIFGRVSSVTESKGETVLVVEEVERNFNPAPVIDLPKYKSKITADCTADVYFQGKGDGWNECLAEIKRLNGLEQS